MPSWPALDHPGRQSRVPAARVATPGSILLLILVGALLTVVAAGDNILPGDVAVARQLQSVDLPGAGTVARAANAAGTTQGTIALAVPLAVALAAGRRFAAAALILATVLVRSLNPLLKRLVDSPRPTPDLVRIGEEADGLGFPSGHAMGAVLFYGAVAYLAAGIERPRLRRTVWALCVGAVLAIGFGRVYVGAHWPSDVIGGYLWGAGLLLALVRLVRLVGR